MNRAILAAALMLAAAIPTAGQQIRPDRYPDSLEIKRVLTKGAWPRVVTVCATGADYKTIPAAVAAVAAKTSAERNWYSRWTILLCPGAGSTDPNTFAPSFTLSAPVNLPDYTSLEGMWSGHNNPIAQMGPVPSIKLSGTSGCQICMGGGSSLANLNLQWIATPTAAGSAVEHKQLAGGDSYVGQLDNVSINVVAGSNAFAMDGIVETSGGLYVYGGGVVIDGNALGRTVLNSNTTAGLGVSLYGGRYAGASGCAALMRNGVAGGTIKLFEGVRLDTGCTNDLVRASSGAVEVYGGVTYATASGVITNGPTHVAYSSTLPATCSPGEVYADTTTAAPRLCQCRATDTWSCSATMTSSASAPYACDAGHAGAVYVDTTTPSLCFCTGSAWVTTVAAGNCT